MMARASGNPLLYIALTSIIDLMRQVLCKITPDAGATQKELEEHRRLLEAIYNRNGELAGELMDTHLRKSQRRLEVLAESRGGTADDLGANKA